MILLVYSAIIEHTIAGKSFIDIPLYFNANFLPIYYTNHKKNGKIIYNYFKDKYGKRKCRPCI